MRAKVFPLVSLLIFASSYGVPLLVVIVLLGSARNQFERYAVFLATPILVSVIFATTAGICSLPFQRYIIPGKFRRNLNDTVYFGRRAYGLCWTALYYCTPVYFLCLSFAPLKWLTFRLFGYRGSMNFVIYPDTWIRDLPLLNFGDCAYLSNKATVGTNIALSNGLILVGPITFKAKSY
jgi:hypothetical protein